MRSGIGLKGRHDAMVRVGISGWNYKGWRGTFYPDGLKQKLELHFASRAFSSIEINGTHYALQHPDTFRHWREETPEEFVFSVKGSRFITHLKRLREIETPLANFFASGVLALREKLGPFLWQFPPNFRFDEERMEHFFKLLPKTAAVAVQLARKHDDRLKGKAWLGDGGRHKLRHCVEVRHESFMVPEFFALLRKYGMAFVFADTAGKWPYTEDLTSDFVYIRLHGDEELYVSGYGKTTLQHWASRIQRWRKGGQPRDAKLVTRRKLGPKMKKDVYVYFDNDAKVKAPGDARQLIRLLKI